MHVNVHGIPIITAYVTIQFHFLHSVFASEPVWWESMPLTSANFRERASWKSSVCHLFISLLQKKKKKKKKKKNQWMQCTSAMRDPVIYVPHNGSWLFYSSVFVSLSLSLSLFLFLVILGRVRNNDSLRTK